MKNIPPFLFTKLSGCLILVFTLAACQSTTINTSSTIQLPDQFTHAQGSADIAQWWQNWHDPILNQLIERSLQTNHDIKIAQSRFQEAAAQARLADADLGAKVGIDAQINSTQGEMDNPTDTHTRSMIQQASPQHTLAKDPLNLDSTNAMLGLSASWEPDIFGAKRSDADAAKAGALSVAQQIQAAYLLTAARVAEHYFQARALQNQQQHIVSSIRVLQQLLRYTKGRFEAGQTSKYEINEAQAALSTTQAKLATLQAQYQAHVRAIAVLLGDTPQTFRLPESHINVLNQPAAAPHGILPSELLSRRPDLRARAAHVQAHAAKLASAKADLYPRFSINFLGQGIRISLTGDKVLNGWGGLISAGISLPIFTNGRIQANIATADAQLQTALLEYDRSLLQALSEVDNAYQLSQSTAKQNQSLQQAQTQYHQRANDARKLFQYGNRPLDTALRAQLASQEANERLTQGQLAHAQSLLGIYKALGGGW